MLNLVLVLANKNVLVAESRSYGTFGLLRRSVAQAKNCSLLIMFTALNTKYLLSTWCDASIEDNQTHFTFEQNVMENLKTFQGQIRFYHTSRPSTYEVSIFSPNVTAGEWTIVNSYIL